jgi:hypothetical protein
LLIFSYYYSYKEKKQLLIYNIFSLIYSFSTK